ncbi:ornithine carbamoyltransferase [Tenacibaculum aiptasiae]|uniref:ornithine carbamoyltransferase n=1 Tax=Tenacibaculum aiptasiae TaxID=426481 RepID=A0A7J5AMN4_9FLAO|nr:ornithine carbamoyltransferase [Tenacibaculum aiptasiae]KAB1158710.1 ornithine carbamoyltransferase [Tenacibaculum aiptasiae]
MSLISTNSRKHVISLKDLSPQETLEIINRGIEYSNGNVEQGYQLKNKVLGVYFKKTSTRTRTAFTTAALRLGAQVIAYGPNDLQLNTGETMGDTLQVLSRMLDGLVLRTAESPKILKAFANQKKMSIVNAMTEDEHPTQALADLTTIKQYFGELSGLEIVYLGEGNNTTTALALAIAKFSNMKINFFTPPNYNIDPMLLKYAQEEGKKRNTTIKEFHDLRKLPKNADIVYTTRWQTTGTTKPDPNWRKVFEPFTVTEELMNTYTDAIFMHDLPAHRGDEVEASVIDGVNSIVFNQAENKAHSAKAVLEWCMH